jgi:hypothetical protein
MTTPGNDPQTPSKLDLHKITEYFEWKKDPAVGFDQRASLTIAQ